MCGCTTLTPPADASLFRDALFKPSSAPAEATRVFELDDAMRRYADTHLRPPGVRRDPRRALVEALGRSGNLRLAYDASHTGTAAETFHARSGNCLSLALMTAAFARHLDLPVTFRAVLADPEYERVGGLVLQSGHVNLQLSHRGAWTQWGNEDLLIDFLPGVDLRGQRATMLSEAHVLALFMNNRAAEALADGLLDDSYAWARAALLQNPASGVAANTLAVVYMRRGERDAAEAALRHALARDATNTAALSNLAQVLRQGARTDEAQVIEARLAALQPHPPFHFLELGRQALASGDAARAADWFTRELRRQPYQHEVHFWAAQAWLQLGDGRRAAEHLRAAMDYSPTVARQRIYGAKLDRLRLLQLQ
jgi:tetratricopeptide (TPR) repeat protein